MLLDCDSHNILLQVTVPEAAAEHRHFLGEHASRPHSKLLSVPPIQNQVPTPMHELPKGAILTFVPVSNVSKEHFT